MHHLQELARERLPMLYNLMPEGVGEKYAGSYILRIDNSKTITPSRYNSKLPSPRSPTAKTLRKVMTTIKFTKKPEKLNTSKTQVVASKRFGASDEDDRAALLLATGRIGKPITFNVADYPTIALYDKGCITCGKENIETKYHGMRHICPNCRNYIKTYDNDKAYIYLSEDGEIVCKGTKISKKSDGTIISKKVYDVPQNELKIFEYRCFATLSGPAELVILLHDKQNIPPSSIPSFHSTRRSFLPQLNNDDADK